MVLHDVVRQIQQSNENAKRVQTSRNNDETLGPTGRSDSRDEGLDDRPN